MSDPTRRITLAAVVDVVCIVVFVMLGRSSHHESGTFVASTLKVAAPFLIALGAGWVAARAWKAPLSPASGVTIWLVTVSGGMVLRHFVFSRGTALAFIVVATLFTGLFLVGWRLVASRVLGPYP